MKRILTATLLAFLAAVVITALYRPQPLEDQLLHLQLERAVPAHADALTDESPELKALFLMYADDPILLPKAQLALLRYPDLARPIFLNFGDSPAFQSVLRQYGEDVILPIHYFVTNEVFTLEVMRSLTDTAKSALSAVRGLWGETEPADPLAGQPLSPEERGWYAIHFLESEGYDFLGQFVLTGDGEVSWVQTERILEGINRLFASGIKGLETKFRRDDAITAGDVGWAAVDVAIGVTALKVLRMGRVATAGGRSLTFSQRSAALGAGLWRGSVLGARMVKYGAPAVLAYMAIRHPSVLNSLMASAAEKLGVPVAAAQVIGWTLVLLPVVLVLRFLLAPLVWILGGLLRLFQWGRPVPQ